MQQTILSLLLATVVMATGCAATNQDKMEDKMASGKAAMAEKKEQASMAKSEMMAKYEATMDGATKAISDADAERKKAAKVGGEWRDTGKFLKQAEEAAKKGDFKKALKLAKKASSESKLGYEQAVSQQDLVPFLFK